MANPLDWAARAILQINGLSPEEITKRSRQLKAGQGRKPMPKTNTARPVRGPVVKKPVRKSRVNGRLVTGTDTRPSTDQAKEVRQGPRTSNVKQQVDIRRSPRAQQKADGPIGPNSRYTPRSQQQADPKAPSSTLRKLQAAAGTPPRTPAPSQRRPGPGTSSRPLGTADVGPKGPVGRLGQRTGMNVNGSTPSPRSTQKADGPIGPQSKPNAGNPKSSDAQKANMRWLEQNSKAARDQQRDLAKKFDAVRNFSTKGSVAALAASNFGNEGESPDVRARRLGFKDAADQKTKIAAQQRSSAPARTPEQAIKDAKKSPGKPPTASNTRNSPAAVNTPQYRRPKANVSKPSAAKAATQQRDYKKLKDFG